MTTDITEKGLETLIMRHMTGADGLPAAAAGQIAETPENLTADIVTGKLDVREAAEALPEPSVTSVTSDKSDLSDSSDLSDNSDLTDISQEEPEMEDAL